MVVKGLLNKDLATSLVWMGEADETNIYLFPRWPSIRRMTMEQVLDDMLDTQWISESPDMLVTALAVFKAESAYDRRATNIRIAMPGYQIIAKDGSTVLYRSREFAGARNKIRSLPTKRFSFASFRRAVRVIGANVVGFDGGIAQLNNDHAKLTLMQIFDPLINLDWAHSVYGLGGWNRWMAYTANRHVPYVDQAHKLVQLWVRRGWID